MDSVVSRNLSFEERRGLGRFERPLNLIFWGGLFIILDFNLFTQVGSHRSSIDILPDAVGFVLVAVGFGILAFGKFFTGTFDLVITGVAAAFAVFAAMSLSTWFNPALERLAPWGGAALGAVGGFSLLAFSFAMRSVALRFGLLSLAKAWLTIGLLFLAFYTLPQAFFLIPAFSKMLGVYAMLFFIPSLIPFIGMFLAALQMKRIASGVIKPTSTMGGTV